MKSTYHSELICRNQKHLNRQKEIGKQLRILHDKIDNNASPEVLKEYIKNMIEDEFSPFLGEFDKEG